MYISKFIVTGLHSVSSNSPSIIDHCHYVSSAFRQCIIETLEILNNAKHLSRGGAFRQNLRVNPASKCGILKSDLAFRQSGNIKFEGNSWQSDQRTDGSTKSVPHHDDLSPLTTYCGQPEKSQKRALRPRFHLRTL